MRFLALDKCSVIFRNIWHKAVALLVLASAFPASGEELRSLPLASLQSKLPATAEDGRKAIDERDYGVVAIQERALAVPITIAEADDARLALYSDVFDYYLLKLTVGAAGLDGSQVKKFQFSFSLPTRRVENSDIWIVDVFPRLETTSGRVSADAEIGVSGQLEIKPHSLGTPADAKIDGRASVAWTYNPIFQSYAAVFSETTAIWSFDNVGNALKAGPIDVYLLIAVKKAGRVAELKGMNLEARIRAEFTGGLFFGRYAGTAATVRVRF